MIRQDIELANNNAHMLSEAVSFADPDLEAVEENDLIKVRVLPGFPCLT